MSTMFSSVSLGSSTLDTTADATSTGKPTVSQQMQQLSSSGLSANQIASQLGVPVSEVDIVLGVKTTAEASLEQAVADARHLSIKV